MELINYLLPRIEHLHSLGYWILFLIVLLESLAFIGMLVPGTFLILLFGSLAANGFFSIGDLIWFAVAGAVLGDISSFFLGKKGTGFFSENNRVFRTGYLEKGKVFFRRHGVKSIFLGRFVGPVRAVIPFIAGLSGMDPGRFFFWDILSAAVWASSHLLLGYFLGHAWRFAEAWSTRIGIFLVSLAIFLVCGYLLKRFILQKGKQLFAFLASLITSAGQAIRQKPAVSKFLTDHPRMIALIQGRLRPGEFSGLPLTLLAIAFFYIMLLLLGVIEEVVTSDTIVTVDRNIENLLFVYRDPVLVKVFLWVTVLGKLDLILVMTLAGTLVFLVRNRVSFIVPLFATLGGSYFFIILGKEALHRPRPAGLAVYREYFFSFPSGHATIAMAFYGYMAYYLWSEIETLKNRLNILFAAGVVILAIGFSRLYLGAHFLSDVLGGYLLGLLWLIIGICIRELRLLEPVASPVHTLRPQTTRILTTVIIAASCGFYVYSAHNFHPARFFPEQQRFKIISYDNIIKIFSSYRLPRYTESITGEKQQPLSLIIAAKDSGALAEAFGKAGWQKADPVSFASLAKTANAFLFNERYPLAPMTPSFWNERVNDLNFVKVKPLPGVKKRHEARFWKTDFMTADGRKIYAGNTIISESPSRRIIPRIGPRLDDEREGLFRDLLQSGEVASFSRLNFVPPMSGRSFTGEVFYTDGYLYIIRLN